jgi:hypothetical protein
MGDEVAEASRVDGGARPIVQLPRVRSRRSASKLSPPWRKLLMAVHLIVSLGLLGSDLAVLVLVVDGLQGADAVTVYPAAHLIGVTLLVPLALLAIATGVVQGLLTPWGLVKYWWVTIKLVLTAAGAVLAVFVLTPALAGAAQSAMAAVGATVPLADRIGLVRDSSAASTVLVVIVLLSLYKPFGRLLGRKSR